MKSIDELENDPSNNLVCGLWDEVAEKPFIKLGE